MTVNEAMETYKDAQENVAVARSRLGQAQAGFSYAENELNKAAETLKLLLTPHYEEVRPQLVSKRR